MEEEKPFDYCNFWEEKEKKELKEIKKEIWLEKGKPRKGIKGRYIKPKNYVSRRSSIKTVKSFAWNEKKIE